MKGIKLNENVRYDRASLRFFNPGEHHVTRVCPSDVMLLVYEGVLRFSEDGARYEVRPGEYFIQRKGAYQSGEDASDSPKYLFVHFFADWGEDGEVLPYRGIFDYKSLKTDIEKLNALSYGDAPYVAQAGIFFNILASLYTPRTSGSAAKRMADYISENLTGDIGLLRLCSEFHFSKNHIINVFKKEFGKTPVEYINGLRLFHAEYLAEVTSDTLEKISIDCGFRSYSHFYKLFLRRHGRSPEQWRRDVRFGGNDGRRQ